MAAAHELCSPAGEFLNLVHRDLTPENVLVSFYGEVKVTDFGLAKAKRRASRTITGLVKGAREYMAPEQIEGLPLDRRVDIFALGVMLFELFSGRKPWVSKSGRDTMHQIVEAPPPDLGKLRPGIHSVLVGVVERCLAKDPSNRFQTALDLDRELVQWLMLHGYHENQDHLARFVRRNAMRQMRWCERAMAGEFADGRGPNLAAAPPVTPADEALLASGELPPSAQATRVEPTPVSSSALLQPALVMDELSDSALITDPDGVAMEMTNEGDEVSTLIQRPEHARMAARAAMRLPRQGSESTDSILTKPAGGGEPPQSTPRIDLAALGGGVQGQPAGTPLPGASAPTGPAMPAVVPGAPLAPASGMAPAVGHMPGAPPLATRRPNTLRPGPVPRSGDGRNEPPGAPIAREAPAPREAVPSVAVQREAAAVQRQAQAVMEEATRVGGRAETAADRARAAAARAISAADVARKAGQRAERAAAAAELAREAILLVSAGNVAEARERLQRAEQLRESSRSAADDGNGEQA
jgi:serine/threonine-protein kinase